MKILQSMYERGFVLVRLHDVAYEVTAEDGSRYFQEGDIMLRKVRSRSSCHRMMSATTNTWMEMALPPV